MHPLRTRNPVIRYGRGVVNDAMPLCYRQRPVSRRRVDDEIGRRDGKLARLEAALWLADEPLSEKKLCALARLADVAETRRLLLRLRELFDADRSPFQIEELAGGYQLLTRSEYYPWLVRLNRSLPETKLSAALMETLAIIAYRQPIMRAELEDIRGVHCGDAIRALMERKLVYIAGRHESLGRPVLYGTTKKFLQAFGLRDLSELPPVSGVQPGKSA